MSDPYKILGVSRNATDEEIKKAYRRLSRKYHPDANVNSPHPEIAEEKFKEIQQAYTQIMNEKQQGYTGGYQNGSAWGYEEAFRRSQSQYEEGSESDIRMKAAANYINSGYYREALNALQTVTDRNARWYFFSAVANQGAGNNVQAMEDARQAVNLEPSNMEYRQFLQNMEYGGIWYQDMGSEYEKPFSGNRMLMFLCFIPMLFGGCCFNPFC